MARRGVEPGRALNRSKRDTGKQSQGATIRDHGALELLAGRRVRPDRIAYFLALQGLQPFLALQGLQPFFALQGLQPLALQGLQPFLALQGLQLAS